MYKTIKIIFLYFSKWMGLFRISRYLTRDGLRILCYHNFSLGDEVEWQPGLFIRPKTFRKRLQLLEKERFPVLKLDHALKLLSEKKLPPVATVITIDDGWYGIKLYAHDILSEKSYPYTIYLTSYYSLKESPIFNLVIPYIFWKTQKDQINLEGLGLPLTGTVWLSDTNTSEQVMHQIIDYGQSQLDNHGRCVLAERLGERLGINYSVIEETRILSLLTTSEIVELVAAGVDIQLHTHRHRWPLDERAAIQELVDNKSFLEPLAGRCLQHFCYPSGFWEPQQFPYLDAIGIKSATTCERGLNYSWTPVLTLRRVLDSEGISQIEFESEMFGYLELLRKLRKLVMPRFKVLGSCIKML
jgi:peptidoglycan/xylan/chitin deacetylase (PgdA/CDA1 family)